MNSITNIFKTINELSNYHDKIRQEFKGLITLANEVETKTSTLGNTPKNITKFLLRFWVTVEADIQKEERSIFPLVIEGNREKLRAYMKELISEHIAQEMELEYLISLVEEYQIKDDLSEEWKHLISRIQKTVSGLKNHMAIENQILMYYIGEEITDIDIKEVI